MKRGSITFALCSLILFSSGCEYEHRTLQGVVKDENGAVIPGVSVTACYSGWSWANGSLVWDKSFCSQPARTDESGKYTIDFRGPPAMRLRAVKDGWVQTHNFSNTDKQITLVKKETYQARLAQEANLKNILFLKRRPNESDREYYIRVIQPASDRVTLQYMNRKLTVLQSALVEGNRALFAVRGERQTVFHFSREVILKNNRKPVISQTTVSKQDNNHDTDMFFIDMDFRGQNSSPLTKPTLLVPSIHAEFGMRIKSTSQQ